MSQYATPGGSPSSDAAGSARGRQLLLLGALAVVLAVAVVVYVTRSSGSSSSGQPQTPRAVGHSASASPSASPTTAPAATAVPAAYQAPIGHNPFKPLVVKPTPTPTPTPKPSPTLSPSAFPTMSPTGLPTAGSPLDLTLSSVDPKALTATVTITDNTGKKQTFSAKPGQVFDKYFKLVAILSSDPSTAPAAYGADFQYGDQFIQLAVGDSAQID